MRFARLAALGAVVATVLATPLAAKAQQSAGKVPRIGILDDSSADAAAARTESLRKGLRALGYIEGKNLNIEWRFGEGKQAALVPLATELVQLTPAVLVSS